MSTFAQREDSAQNRHPSPARPDHAKSQHAPAWNPSFTQQQTWGNQALQRLMRTRAIQAKLKINEPGDKYEQEADRVAGEIIRMHSPKSVHLADSPMIQRTDAEQVPTAGREITTADMEDALTGETVEDRMIAVIELFQVGDYMTSGTLLILAGLPLAAPEVEGENRAAVRMVIGAINKVVRTSGGFRIDLNQNEVVAKVKGFNIKLKNGATADIDTSKRDKLKVNLQQVKVQLGVFIDLPGVSISDNDLTILGTTWPLVKEREAEEPETVMPKRDPYTGELREAPSIVHDVLERPGHALDPSIRAFFEPHLGLNLANVRVHTGELAAKSASSINAEAYTYDNNIVFGAGTYQPASNEGKWLLAHELVHVAQQNAMRESPKALPSMQESGLRRVSGGKGQRPSFREISVAATIPFSIGIIRDLADDALNRSSRWAFSQWHHEIAIKSLNGGSADAMRHAFWSAAVTLALGEKIAERFLTAHEVPLKRLAGDEYLKAEMDLFNNAMGRQIGNRVAQRLVAAGNPTNRNLDHTTREEVWEEVNLDRILGKLKAISENPEDGSLSLGTTADPFAF